MLPPAEQPAEVFHYHGVEFAARAHAQLFDSLIEGLGPAIGPVGNHRIESIRHIENPRPDRDLVPFESVGVALPVRAFMMVPYYVHRFLQQLDMRDDLRAGEGVLSHTCRLLGSERTGLGKYLDIDTEFTYVSAPPSIISTVDSANPISLASIAASLATLLEWS